MMDLKTYQANRASRLEALADARSQGRAICRRCRKSAGTCYCARIKPFATGARFVILIHPKEHRKRVGSGRLTHLCISNSTLLEGVDFTRNATVNEILADPASFPVVLYPGPKAVDITEGAAEKLEALVPHGRELVVFIIDGSWFCAKKMLRVSANLKALPQIRFTPQSRSIYQIRRQPKAICFSSVEAVHSVIGWLNASRRWRSEPGHDNLLEVFRFMIDQQLAHVTRPGQKAVRGDRSRV